MSDTSQFVHTAFDKAVLTITLDRPKANAFNLEMVAATRAAFHRAEQDDRVRCVLLIGNGRFFSTGHDVNEIEQVKDSSYREHLHNTYNPLVLQIRRIEKPVLCALNGMVSGAALGIALACDLRIAADSASIVVGFLSIGLVPDAGVSLFLPALIGPGRAIEAIFTNAPIEAEQALRLGLVNRVSSEADLRAQAGTWAQELARGPVHAMGLVKRQINESVYGSLEAVLDDEARLQEIASRGDEHREGVAAFLEKRPPRFSDYS